MPGFVGVPGGIYSQSPCPQRAADESSSRRSCRAFAAFLSPLELRPDHEIELMSNTDDEFAALMERVRNGCPEAIACVLHRYGGHIRQIIRRQLHHRLRTQFDSIDFQQDVWASFFAGDFARYQFDSAESLIRFLSEMAYNKVVEVFRQRMQSIKHDLHREEQLAQRHFSQVAPEVAARHPSPSQLAIANEQWERLLDNQPPACRQMLEMLRQGHTHAEIAEKLDINVKTVQRFVHALKQGGPPQ
jgi:RNA polymerase sigma factor (sigma-70 family)